MEYRQIHLVTLQKNIQEEKRWRGAMSNKNIALYTFEEAREILKCSKVRLRELLDTGELRGFRLGKYKWRIPEEALLDYIKKQMTAQTDK